MKIESAAAMRNITNMNGGVLKSILDEVRLAAAAGKYKILVNLPACFEVSEARELIVTLSIEGGFYIKRLPAYPFQFRLDWDVPRISCKNPIRCYAAKARAKANRFNKVFMLIYDKIERAARTGQIEVTINYEDYSLRYSSGDTDFNNPYDINAIYMGSPLKIAGYKVRYAPYFMTIDWSL